MRIGRQLMTLKELADLLKVHPSTARRLLPEKIPLRRVGGQIRVKPEDVERFLANQT